jgi:hypothetical protein
MTSYGLAFEDELVSRAEAVLPVYLSRRATLLRRSS